MLFVESEVAKTIFLASRRPQKRYFRRVGSCKNCIFGVSEAAKTVCLSSRRLQNLYFCRLGGCKSHIFVKSEAAKKPYFRRVEGCRGQLALLDRPGPAWWGLARPGLGPGPAQASVGIARPEGPGAPPNHGVFIRFSFGFHGVFMGFSLGFQICFHGFFMRCPLEVRKAMNLYLK